MTNYDYCKQIKEICDKYGEGPEYGEEMTGALLKIFKVLKKMDRRIEQLEEFVSNEGQWLDYEKEDE